MTWRIVGALLGAIATVGVAVALLAPTGGGVIDPVAKAADTTAAAGTAEFGLAGSISVAGQTIPIKGNGAVDMRSARMRMSLSFPIPQFGSMEMEEIVDGSAIYMRMPSQLASRIPGGKPWMKFDLEALGKAGGVDLEQMLQAGGQSNPSDMLAALKGVGSSQKVGAEDVNGTQTTHYKATIDLNKALEQIPDKKTADSLEQMFDGSGASSIPFDVWIDNQGRVRQETFSVSINGASVSMTITFTRFGVPLDTTPPPADQVLDAGALLGAIG